MAGVRVNCTPDDFLLSYSKLPLKIYKFTNIYCSIARIIHFDHSGIKAGNITLETGKKVDLLNREVYLYGTNLALCKF